MSNETNGREESLYQASTASFHLWFLPPRRTFGYYLRDVTGCPYSMSLRDILTPSTQIKHTVSLNDTFFCLSLMIFL